MVTFCPRCGSPLAEAPTGAWFETDVTCSSCGLRLADPPLMLAPGPAEEEVDYSLAEWLVPERAAATAALADVDIPYRWEPDLILVVPAVAEVEVDRLLEDLDAVEPTDTGDGDLGDSGDEDLGDDDDREDEPDVLDPSGGAGEDVEEDEEDGGEEAQAAMADLFVVADRLQHDPEDADLAGEAGALGALVGASAPPYGIERALWRRIQALAGTLVTTLEERADDEAIVDAARAVRDFLRDLV